MAKRANQHWSKLGSFSFTKEQKTNWKGIKQVKQQISWTIGIESLNKHLADVYGSEYSRDLIWEVVQAKANRNGNQWRVRKSIPDSIHTGEVFKKDEKKIKVWMIDNVLQVKLAEFEKHFQEHIQTQDEEAKELESPTFEAFAREHWLKDRNWRNVSAFERWVFPVLGSLKMDEISHTHIDKFVRRASKGCMGWDGRKKKQVFGKLTENTLNRLHRKVGGVFRLAQAMDGASIADGQEPHILNGRMPYNRILMQEKPRAKKHTKLPPSKSENMTLLENIAKEDKPLHYLIVVALFTGLRISEVLALQWSDIRWEEEKVEVTKQWDRHNKVLKPTKTSSETTRILLPVVIETLKEWKEVAPSEKEVADNSTIASNGQYHYRGTLDGGRLPICTGKFIFSHPRGTPFDYATLLGRLNKVQDKMGLKKEGQAFHAFRRSFVSELAAAIKASGRDPVSLIQKLGGWGTRSTVEDYLYDVDRHSHKKTLQEAFDSIGYAEILKSAKITEKQPDSGRR